MRKLIARACTAVLVAGILLPVMAAPARAAFDPCGDLPAHNRHQGMIKASNGAVPATYVAAYITPGREFFGPCSTGTGPFQHDGTFAYISIEPDPVTGKTGIMQIGVTTCADSAYTFCQGKGVPHYFIGILACDFSRHAWDLGAANYNRLPYRIQHNGSQNRWEFVLNGVIKLTVADSSSMISCWGDLESRANWFTETWDEGDSIGHWTTTAGDKRTKFDTMRLASNYGTIVSPSFVTANPCMVVEEGSNNVECDVTAGDAFSVWTTG